MGVVRKMSITGWSHWLIQPAFLGLVLGTSGVSAIAAEDPSAINAESLPANTNSSRIEQIQQYSNETTDENSLGQITNASQFRDVQPSDWAYEALDRIVQKYG
jgi:hypothetical protein